MRKNEKRNPNRLCARTKTPIGDWLKARDFKWQRLWKQVGEHIITFVDGIWMNEGEFDEKYPSKAPTHFYANQENPNRTKNFSI